MIIDLRSDTVTKPSQGMLDAMSSADVGDDVFGEDLTVNTLEQKVAKLFGKEAAIFCPSGTMSNQIAVKIHTNPGDEVICDRTAHIYNYEGGGLAFNSGVSTRLLHGDFGRFTSRDVLENINPDDIHFPATTLVSVENTVNKGGGSVFDIEVIKEIADVARQNKLGVHLDGARIFNALSFTGTSTGYLGKCFDTISVCFSKGLGAPIGSALLGSQEMINKARRIRKVLGGGMRQAGYLAAACNYALDNNINRLTEDHNRAFELAKILESKPYVKKVLNGGTNIVITELNDDVEVSVVLEEWKTKGLLAVPFGKGKVRFVTHLDFTDDMLYEVGRIL